MKKSKPVSTDFIMNGLLNAKPAKAKPDKAKVAKAKVAKKKPAKKKTQSIAELFFGDLIK